MRICEIFNSIQGEGYHTGTPMTFVRVAGCNLKCSFCDSKGAWDAEKHKDESLEKVLKKLEKDKLQRWILITGGEPLLYDEELPDLVFELKKKGRLLALETNGTLEAIKTCKAIWDWVAVSPKPRQQLPFKHWVQRASEVKWLVKEEEDILEAKEYFWREVQRYTKFYLQPISQDEEATKLCIEACLENNWGLSIQTHKYLGIR